MNGTEKRGGEAKILKRGGHAGSRGGPLKIRVAGTPLRTMEDIFKLNASAADPKFY